MLWSFGAAVGVLLLRQWPQVLWLAVLAPAWLWGEWMEAQPPGHVLARHDAGCGRNIPAGLQLLGGTLADWRPRTGGARSPGSVQLR